MFKGKEKGSPWRVKASEELEKHPELKQEDLDTIRTWITSQSHLPHNVDGEKKPYTNSTARNRKEDSI